MTPPTDVREIAFESYIEAALLAGGYHSITFGEYDREHCLLKSELIAFVRATQPIEFAKLVAQHGQHADAKLVERLDSELKKHGLLKMLREGVSDHGANFRLAYFKPASGLNPVHEQLYRANRFSVVRQLRYNLGNENAIDLVLFLNGLPLATIELKNSLTGQTVDNAIAQYKYDRNPQNQPLLQFKRCLVHFAVGNEAAFMATHLQGPETRFFPFNLDAINPAAPGGYKTHYLWEDTWQPDSLLELIHNYLHLQSIPERVFDAKFGKVVEKTSEALIFPRYHQLDCVRTLLKMVRVDGVGKSYLVQHSAGSGKSNTIAWLAHHLASFYRNESDSERMFDSIVVVTDRKVLDKQLQNTIRQFEQIPGVVMCINENSKQLEEALTSGKSIIITTLQKFPVISKTIGTLTGQHFAVLIDEAHSSQSGESAGHLNRTLSTTLQNAEQMDQPAPTGEDAINSAIEKAIKERAHQKNISYFAFTATPKNKTLELFGHKKQDGGFVAHHIYTMRQAIAEGFILDVLKNYTTFKRYFNLIKTIPTDNEYEKRKAVKLLTKYVDLSEHAIEKKCRIILEHFVNSTEHEIEGKARAMVVTRSRLHAVRFYQMIQTLVDEMKLPYGALVAFSGEVKDSDSGATFTESGMNILPSKVDIADAFKMPEYRILVVANKYQTGFDEPLLHTMFVDKRLDGVQAVQTLSRLNRTRTGKNGTMVLDFVNDAEQIEKAFEPYYQTTFLEEGTDQNLLYDLLGELKDFGVYTTAEVDAYAIKFFDPKKGLDQLQYDLDVCVGRWSAIEEEDRKEAFRGKLQQFIRMYGFLSQIILFVEPTFEKSYVFAKGLNRKLPKREIDLPYEILDEIDLKNLQIQKTYEGELRKPETMEPVTGFTGGGMKVGQDKEFLYLSKIVETINKNYGLNLSTGDEYELNSINRVLLEDQELIAALRADNSPEAMRHKFKEKVNFKLLGLVKDKVELYQNLQREDVNRLLVDAWFTGMLAELRRIDQNRPGVRR
jgi:type I restriction enzyme R subunit